MKFSVSGLVPYELFDILGRITETESLRSGFLSFFSISIFTISLSFARTVCSHIPVNHPQTSGTVNAQAFLSAA
jgi:hypothetical protein